MISLKLVCISKEEPNITKVTEQPVVVPLTHLMKILKEGRSDHQNTSTLQHINLFHSGGTLTTIQVIPKSREPQGAEGEGAPQAKWRVGEVGVGRAGEKVAGEEVVGEVDQVEGAA